MYKRCKTKPRVKYECIRGLRPNWDIKYECREIKNQTES